MVNALRLTLCLSTAVALLAGCNGSQPPSGVPGTLPQSHPVAQHVAPNSNSWMLREATKDDLLYVSNCIGGVCIYSYPAAKLVGKLQSGGYVCPDQNGNVFQLTWNSSGNTVVFEYPHGGTQPIETLQLGRGEPLACSVDPVSDNLAISIIVENQIAIVPRGSQSPNYYKVDFDVAYVGYDNAGNLFVDGLKSGVPVLAELRAGENKFLEFPLRKKTFRDIGQVQWDGQFMTVEELQKPAIYRLSLEGSQVKIVGITTFDGVGNRATISWIQGSSVILPYGLRSRTPKAVGVWPYPGGGKGTTILKKFPGKGLGAATVSINPSRHR